MKSTSLPVNIQFCFSGQLESKEQWKKSVKRFPKLTLNLDPLAAKLALQYRIKVKSFRTVDICWIKRPNWNQFMAMVVKKWRNQKNGEVCKIVWTFLIYSNKHFPIYEVRGLSTGFSLMRQSQCDKRNKEVWNRVYDDRVLGSLKNSFEIEPIESIICRNDELSLTYWKIWSFLFYLQKIAKSFQ